MKPKHKYCLVTEQLTCGDIVYKYVLKDDWRVVMRFRTRREAIQFWISVKEKV